MKKNLMLLLASAFVAVAFTGCFEKQPQLAFADCKEVEGKKCLTDKELQLVDECKKPTVFNKKTYCGEDK